MKNRTLMKRISVFAMLCVLTMTLFVEPSFAGTYEVNNGGVRTAASAPRAAACDKMTEMSKMKWTLSETLRYCTRQSGGKLLEESKVSLNRYRNGLKANGLVERKGIPYSQVDREYSFPSGAFTLTYGTKTLLIGDKTYRSVHGTDCASSVAFAWRKGTGNNSASSSFLKRTTSNAIYTTENMFNDAMDKGDKVGTGNFIKVVGNYGKYNKTSAANTKDVVDALSATGNYGAGQDIYSEVYAKIKPGDALLFRGTSGHVRLVTGVDIVYKDTAKTQIDLENSSVHCVEQVGFNRDNHNWSSSWIPNDEIIPSGKPAEKNFDGIYTFNQLAGKKESPTVSGKYNTNCYIPIRLNAWS